ncbi:MAG: hypothetical protein IJL60_09405 [Clostridiales bacterium]|nr:hypothetical protein [Clostridiales bacterium]
MNENNYSIEKLNECCESVLGGQDLNFGKAIVQSYKHDLSVCAKYQAPGSYCVLIDDNGKLKGASINDLSPQEKAERGEFYYGVSPKLDSKKLIKLLATRRVKTSKDLGDFVRDNLSLFALHENQKNYLPSVAKYIVVCMAHHFGLRLGFNKRQTDEIIEALENKGYSREAINTLLKYDDQNKCLVVHGFPTIELLGILNDYKYSRRIETKEGKKKKQAYLMEVWVPEKDGVLSIEKLYEEHTTVVRGKVFYSGVLLKPTSIEHLHSYYENDKIQSICFTFEKTTYGTVCAFDNNLTEHPLIDPKTKQDIVLFFKEDDHKKQDLVEKLKDCEDMGIDLEKKSLDAVNDYLKKSNNVNQVCVSANIVTSDDYVILGRRSAGSIDNKSIYPGVNGNAEVADGDVSFYNESVYEDYPTIRTDGHRIDFFGEIGRETYGELHQDLTEQEWIAYGVTLSGNTPIKTDNNGTVSYNQPFRRMHFNIILEHPCSKTLSTVEKESVQAAEAFETKSYLGVKAICETNHGSFVLNSIKRWLLSLVTHKEVLDSMIAIALFFLAYTPYAGEEKVSFPPSDWIDSCKLLALCLAVLLVLYELIKVGIGSIRYCKSKKYRKTIRIYKKMEMNDIHARIQKALTVRSNGEKISPIFHPAAYLSLLMYVANKASDTFYPTDRR